MTAQLITTSSPSIVLYIFVMSSFRYTERRLPQQTSALLRLQKRKEFLLRFREAEQQESPVIGFDFPKRRSALKRHRYTVERRQCIRPSVFLQERDNVKEKNNSIQQPLIRRNEIIETRSQLSQPLLEDITTPKFLSSAKTATNSLHGFHHVKDIVFKKDSTVSQDSLMNVNEYPLSSVPVNAPGTSTTPTNCIKEVMCNPNLKSFHCEKSIPATWKSTLKKAFKSADDETVTRYVESNVRIKGKSFKRLQEGRWLDDEIINGFGCLVNVRSKLFFGSLPRGAKTHIRRTYMFSSFFFSKLCRGKEGFDYRAVKRWTERANIDICAYELLLFPVLVHGNHWALCAVDIEERELLYLDSLNDKDRYQVLNRIKRWLVLEIKTRKGKKVAKHWRADKWVERTNLCKEKNSVMEYLTATIPKQTDTSSCGVFALRNADCLSMGTIPSFAQTDISFLRNKIAIDLIRKFLPSYLAH